MRLELTTRIFPAVYHWQRYFPKTGGNVLSAPFAVKLFHTSHSMKADDYSWQGRRAIPGFISHHRGPLVELPDWSYAGTVFRKTTGFPDGRPAPLGGAQRERKLRNMEYTRKIIRLLGEVDFAVNHRKEMLQSAAEERSQLLQKKLKPKGDSNER